MCILPTYFFIRLILKTVVVKQTQNNENKREIKNEGDLGNARKNYKFKRRRKFYRIRELRTHHMRLFRGLLW